MKSVRTAFLVVSLPTILAGCTLAASAEDDGFVTLLSAPGKLEIVRHPPAEDYSKMHGSGKITALPSYDADSEDIWQVDLRSGDLSALDVRDRLSDLMQATFDSKTVWPAQLPSGFDVEQIMELGKNPGLGLRAVHRRGITGKGVGLAIIDQALLVDHVEYKDQLRLYEEIHWHKGSPAQMHGPAVASIAVGKTVGVAPEADLYFIAEWHCRSTRSKAGFEFELTPLAQAIDRLVAINKTLPPEHRIRVISISLGINPRMAGFDLTKQAIARAEKEGIYTVYVQENLLMGLGREPLADPDRNDSYGYGHLLARSWQNKGTAAGIIRRFGILWLTRSSLVVPMDSRCTAAPNGDCDYVFYRTGGMSWTVPWSAGLYALACQVQPDITPTTFWEVARKTSVAARVPGDGASTEFGRMINPEGLLGALP